MALLCLGSTANAAEYSFYVGGEAEWADYLTKMARLRTWGDVRPADFPDFWTRPLFIQRLCSSAWVRVHACTGRPISAARDRVGCQSCCEPLVSLRDTGAALRCALVCAHDTFIARICLCAAPARMPGRVASQPPRCVPSPHAFISL